MNLSLRVTGKRPDGYHLISSLFAKVDLADTLAITVTDDGAVAATCSDPALAVDESNLAVKAALALQKAGGTGKGARLELTKRIPVAAGLGGGSADAAGALAALNAMWGVEFSQRRLAELALTLGADVPFFLGGPMAWVEGIGELITPLAPRRPIPILLANPGFPISAADAYKGSVFTFSPVVDKEGLLEAALGGDPAALARYAQNDLEPWAMAKYPRLARLKSIMERTEPRPLAVAMSGSGPTLFAIHATDQAAQMAMERIKEEAPFVYAAKTMIGGLQAL